MDSMMNTAACSMSRIVPEDIKVQFPSIEYSFQLGDGAYELSKNTNPESQDSGVTPTPASRVPILALLIQVCILRA